MLQAMKFNSAKLLLLAICLPRSLAGQSNQPVIPDPYKNFVGDWVGQSRYVKNDVPKSDLIELTVAELPKRKGLRFDYTYSKPGEPDYDKSTRYMRFKEEKKDVRVVLRWEGSISDTVYVSRDMENFIQHGLGTFTIIEKPEETQGQSPLFRGKFQLSIDKLTYEWEASSDGKNFYPTAYFVFTRKVAGTNSARTNPVTP